MDLLTKQVERLQRNFVYCGPKAVSNAVSTQHHYAYSFLRVDIGNIFLKGARPESSEEFPIKSCICNNSRLPDEGSPKRMEY